ncbi:hypothetical protein FACS189494_03460 [Spirochaetia bacterium]|nr:hypothetical protein FACS189494_03460 [Spirochaetia bacterium]
MKKPIFLLFAVFCLAFQVGAQEQDEAGKKEFEWPSWLDGKNASLVRGSRQERYFEIGLIGANVGLLNSQLNVFDLLKGAFDFNPKNMKGDFSLAVDFFAKPIDFKFHVGSLFNMEIFTGVEATVYADIGGGTLDSIDKITGLQKELEGVLSLPLANQPAAMTPILNTITQINGGMGASGNAFAEIGVAGSKTILSDRLYLRVAPSVYFTLLYLPESSLTLAGYGDSASKYIGLKSQTNDGLYAYSPFNFNNFNFADMFSSFGLDLALEGRFALFPILDVGTTINHIPIIPSTLRYKSGLDLNIDVNIPNPLSPDWASEIMAGNLPGEPKFNTDIKFSNSEPTSKLVMRPTRFDFYLMLKPFSSQLLVIKPMVGFSLNTVLAKSSTLNWGVDVRLNLPAIFSVTIGTGAREEIWKQHLGIELDFRVFELDFGVALQGTSFVNSWQGKGIGAALAVKFGF